MNQECPTCKGSGIQRITGQDNNILEEPCDDCAGTGEVTYQVSFLLLRVSALESRIKELESKKKAK